ncbi:helix-turn-helix transcriptional regulator [Rubellicoccus peritrichatus]|uniref:Helix-turn-helix domain-containing protein n=1 Tax=Rubellicoccus peritrichatus TaxID=3080537 RepID=A0AAQ3QR34_9BACT|nr:helix-turn-helix domain-containing protein [Puniceicoccus sp. CR14]WOO40913.1 helix-turn-helix domain-containing protein [Puniceicoccus sp. CR14]
MKDLLPLCLKTMEAAFEGSRLPEIWIPSPGIPFKHSPGALFHAFPEIFFQLSATNQFECPGHSHGLKAGEICIMPAGVPHRETGHGHPFSAFVIVHDARRFVLLEMRCAEGQKPWVIPVGTYPVANGRQLADLLSETANSFLRESLVAEHLFRSYLGLVIETIYASDGADDSGISPIVSKCMSLLFAEMTSEDLTLGGIAQRLNCNADSLSARFSREVGQTAMEYLANLRIERARGLLEEGVMTISEIAWSCGYRDPNYFSRLFKKRIGITPSQFRNQSAAKLA